MKMYKASRHKKVFFFAVLFTLFAASGFIIGAPKYTLTVDNGSGDGKYSAWQWVQIIADPPPSGKIFDRWRGENGPCANKFSPTTWYFMPAQDAYVWASYKDPPTYTLQVDWGSGDGDYPEGTVVNIVANPPPSGKVFNRWRGDDYSYCADRYSPSTTFTMPDHDCYIYAYYTDAPGGGSTTTTTTTTPTTTSTTTTTTPVGTTTTTTTTIPPEEEDDGQEKQYSIIAVGTVRGVTKVITLEGIARKTWAQFAMWMNDNKQIYFKSGEKFYGHVHSNNKMWFSGDPEFFADCTSAALDYGGSTNQCIFHKGFKMGEPTDSMADINFTRLRTKSSMVVTGITQVALSGTNLLITNPRNSWVNQPVPLTNEFVLYVVTASSGSDRYGDVFVGGTLDGRVTIVTDRDINITNHTVYTDDPKTNSHSDDALGLIAKGDIIVKPSCPNNLKIYAHMIASGIDSTRSGSFGVENYNSGSPRGTLYVHGGIVQDTRGAVGTFNPSTGQTVTGYDKNYTFDTRFITNPPPQYPPLSDRLLFQNWKDR